MGMHVWNGSAWKAINDNGGDLSSRGFSVYDGSLWATAVNGKIWNGSSWVGFLDNITLYDDYVSATGFDFANASWGINSTNGNILTGGDVSAEPYALCANQANLGQYQIKVDVSSGSLGFPSAASGTWISCSSGPIWQVYSTSGEVDVTFTASVRNTITTEVLATSIISLYANAEGG